MVDPTTNLEEIELQLWNPDPNLERFVDQTREKHLRTWVNDPTRLREDANSEARIWEGSYRDRQVMELVQNGVDAARRAGNEGRVVVRLSSNVLYAANNGRALDADGLRALLYMYLSDKEGSDIGRFGVGFKSLLGVSTLVEVFSRTVSFSFDTKRSTEVVRGEIPDTDLDVPSMRLAWCNSAAREFALDANLTDLARWATTIVRVHLRQESEVERLVSQMAAFRLETLLLLGFPLHLELDSGDGSAPVHCQAAERDGLWYLGVKGTTTQWRRFESTVRMEDEAALLDAGRTHRREDYTLVWAIPLKRAEKGHFWAWFQLKEESRLPGILQAPWKMNDDRMNLIDGPFNRAIAEEMARLVVSGVSSLSMADDPGSFLDFLPVQEGGSGFSKALAEMVWGLLALQPIVPNALGERRLAADVSLHADLDERAVLTWLELADDGIKGRYAHHRCFSSKDRISRLSELRRQALAVSTADEITRCLLWDSTGRCPSAGVWIKEVARTDIEHSKRLLAFIWDMADRKILAQSLDSLRSESFVLSATSKLVSAKEIRFASGIDAVGDIEIVHPALSEDIEAKRVLVEVLQVRPLGYEDHASAIAALRTHQPEACWLALRRASKEVVDILRKNTDFWPPLVRSADGRWQPPSGLLLTGQVIHEVEASERANAPWVIDPLFHRDDTNLLELCGASAVPGQQVPAYRYSSFEVFRPLLKEMREEYRGFCRDEHKRGRAPSSCPQSAHLQYTEPSSIIWPLDLLVCGSPPVRARLTSWLLNRDYHEAKFGHDSQEKYPRMCAVHPTRWLIWKYGLRRSGDYFLPASFVSSLADCSWLKVLFPEIGGQNSSLSSFSDRYREIDESVRMAAWATAHAAADTAVHSDDTRRAVLRSALFYGSLPGKVRLLGEERPINRLLLAPTRMLECLADSKRLATIWLDEKSRPAIVKTGCRPLNYEVLADDRGEPIPLCEIAEGIDEETGADITQEVECRECRNLRIRLEEEEVYAAAWLEGRTLFVDEGASRTDRLRWICNCLFMAGLLKTDAIEAFTKLNEAGFDQRREQVFSLPDLESKVLAIVDGDAQILVGLLDEVDRPTVNQTEKSGRQVAAVFLCTFSCATLQRLASVLKQRGFNPPERWGTDDAIRFAAEMGFPDSYGGSPSHRRDQNLVVDGPMRLEPLHDFQEHVRDSLFGLFEGSGRRRAIILLPTGSGKTRVAVQAAVEAMSKGTIPPKILWVAQSDELCEQAVQCFRQVWWNFGRPFTQLRISRLWGGVGRRMVPDRGPHVVVASIQTLEKRVGDRSFAWLAQAGAVFIDEAHHAITKTYTRVLHWLDETRENEPPIIGLTATAFRGFNEEQSRALIRRFDSLVFPVDIEQAILVRELQRRGILSNAHFDTIESMVQLQFTPEEVAHIETFGEIPDSALMRLIASKDRNERIIQAVLALSPTCRLLLFAINVEHARRLAAALTARGRKAAAIHAGTPSVIRRQLIRDYDSGEIPTLVNYGVLTTGFDAPKTAVIMVARPTFSPNLYQQMIGRGLRGEKNGGTPEGRVITVQDNLELFGERLVFEHFRQMYAND